MSFETWEIQRWDKQLYQMTQLTGQCFTAQQQQTLCLFCPRLFKTISQIGYQHYVKWRWKTGHLKDANGFSKGAWWPCCNHCPTVEANAISCALSNCTDKLYSCCNNKCLNAFEQVKPLALHFPCLRKEEGSFQARGLGVLQVDVLLFLWWWPAVVGWMLHSMMLPVLLNMILGQGWSCHSMAKGSVVQQRDFCF